MAGRTAGVVPILESLPPEAGSRCEGVGRDPYTSGVPLDPIADLGARAKAASRVLATASTEVKDAALLAAADLLLDRHEEILAANADDVVAAEADGRPPTVVDRLRLSDGRL